MAEATKYPDNIFVSLNDLLSMQHKAHGFSLLAKKQKVKSILGGKHASKIRGRGLDFEEVRNYVSGDDIRNIDWKVTARTQKTHTRVYSEEKEKPALIIVDQSKSMFFGSVNKTKSVVAAELAALTAFKVLKQGDRVGGIVFADNGVDYIAPKRDKKNVLRLFDRIIARNRELVDSDPVNFEENLNTLFTKIRNLVTHDYLVVVISDFHRYSKEVIKNLSYIAQHNDVILAKVYDPLEREIPKLKFVAGNASQQIAIEGDKSKVSSNFSEGFDEDFTAFESTMKKYKIPVMKFDTVSSIEDQMKVIFAEKRR